MKQAMQVLTSQNTDDWYTPPEYIVLVRKVFNSMIDLDPASCAAANKIVNAKLYYDQAFDGLSRPWYGNVFCNPPYGSAKPGMSNQSLWANKMVAEYYSGRMTQGILLINSAHGYKWYEDLWVNWAVCCVRERMRFINASGVQSGQAKKAQTFVYFGPWVDKFADVFDSIGRVLLPEEGDS